ncbi:MAG: glycosyltransferase family 4 protein, partial [Candidatus Bathyarchaeia archaeon]
MKICLISNSEGTWIGQDARILKELGHQVKTVVVEGTFGPYRISRLFLKAFQPAYWADIMFCWFAFPAGFVGVVLAKLFRKPVIVNAVGIDVAYVPAINYGVPLRSHWRWLLKWTLRNADKVIAISQESARNVRNLVGNDVEVIYEGIDVNRFRPIKGTGSERESILTLGILSKPNLKRKGFETLIKCIPHVVKEFDNVKFVFVGKKGDGYPVLKELAEKLGASDFVDFAGYKSDDELLELLNQSALFAMPSVHEGFPTV